MFRVLNQYAISVEIQPLVTVICNSEFILICGILICWTAVSEEFQ